MKISHIKLKNYKRFTDLTITNLPPTAKLIILVGPNGSGKTSLFDAFLLWYGLHCQYPINSDKYFHLKSEINDNAWYSKLVNIEFHDNPNQFGPLHKGNGPIRKGQFYFRTAYRNESDFLIDQLKNQFDPTQKLIKSLSENDITVSENYQRLISYTLSGVYNEKNNHKTIESFREELIGKIKSSLNNVFDDLTLSSIGNPTSNGSFYFTKGTSTDFHYKNLSGGEKSAFDIILDLIIKSSYYSNAIFCIDEPEAHMHTRLQSALLEEIYNIIPDSSQLWLATHSLGMLKKAKELEEKNPGSVVFINFDNLNFDLPLVIEPSEINKTIWNKFIEIALDDFSKLILPSTIVICEGTSKGRKYKNFDAQIYSKIFEKKHPDVTFVSFGSISELENDNNIGYLAVHELFKNSKIIKITDRDDKSSPEIEESKQKGINVLSKRHLESYLLDDEIIIKLCNSIGKSSKIEECLNNKNQLLEESTKRNNPIDDIKSASGEIYCKLKSLLELTQCGNTKEAFLRDTITPLITEETKIYQELEKEIFNVTTPRLTTRTD